MAEKTPEERFKEHTQHLGRLYLKALEKLHESALRDETIPGYAMNCSMDAMLAAHARERLEEHRAMTIEEFLKRKAALAELMEF